jgi:hypothetical protein
MWTINSDDGYEYGSGFKDLAFGGQTDDGNAAEYSYKLYKK